MGAMLMHSGKLGDRFVSGRSDPPSHMGSVCRFLYFIVLGSQETWFLSGWGEMHTVQEITD